MDKAMSILIVDQEIKDVYYHGTTGIADGNFTKSLFVDGVVSAVTVTASSIGSGFYSVAFTPNAEGVWSIRIEQTASPNNPAEMEYFVNDDPMITRKHVKNKFVLDKAANTYVLYEDDKVATFDTGTAEETATEITREPS